MTTSPLIERRLAGASMLSSALGMMVGKASAMALGFAFWLIAARLATAEAVGTAAGATSSVMLVVLLASSGLGAALVLRLPNAEARASELVATAGVVTAIISTALAAAALATAAVFLQELDVVATEPLFAAAFVLAAVFGSWIFLADQVSMSNRNGHEVFIRNAANGVITIVALVLGVALFADRPAVLFAAWVVGSATAVAVAGRQLGSTYRVDSMSRDSARGSFRQLSGAGLSNQLLSTAERAPGLLLPIIVAETLSADETAFWYTAWMIAWGVVAVPLSTSNALFAEVSIDRQNCSASVRKALRSSIMIVVPIVIAVVVAAPWIMAIVGEQYQRSASAPLRVLAVAAIPVSCVYLYFALARSTGRTGEAIATASMTGATALCAAAFVSRSGLTAVAIAWLSAQSVSAAWALWRIRQITLHETST